MMNDSSKARRRIVLFGLFGIENLGNESTLWVTLHHLRRRLPDADVACVSDQLPSFTDRYGVEGLPLNPLRVRGGHRLSSRGLKHAYMAVATLVTEPLRIRNAVRLLAGAERLVIVGTGALDDLGQMPWDLPACIARWCGAAKRNGASIELLAVGAGPIQHPVSRLLLKRAVALADTRAYRDAFSRDYMGGLGVASVDDEVVPDLVFAWPSDWLPAQREAGSPPKVVGVGLMEYYGWNVDGAKGRLIYETYIAKMARFVAWLLDSGYHVRLLIGERRSDDEAVRDLLAVLGSAVIAEAGDRLVSPLIESVQDLFREIMLTDLVVATRFHNLVFALAAGRPVISIGYAPKFESLMCEMQLDKYCQNVEALDFERLKSQFRDLAANHAMAMRVVSKKAAEYRRRLEELYDTAFDVGVSSETREIRADE